MAKKLKSLTPGRTFNTFWVLINLSGPRYWKISPSGIEKTGAPAPNEGPVISFDETSDFRVAYPKNGSIKQATKYLLTEKQEKCRVFAGAKMNIGSASVVPYYGTAIARIEQFNHRIFPSSYFIDQLLIKKKIKLTEDRIIGFKFQSPEDDFNIIVLYAIHPNGDISDPQVSLNPPEMELVLRDYAQQNNVDNFEPILFDREDMATIPMGIGYPTEPMIGTTPIRYITSVIALGIFSVAGLSFAYTAYLKLNIESSKSKLVELGNKTKSAQDKVGKVLEEKLNTLAFINSIDYENGLKYVDLVYNKESKIESLNMSRSGGEIKMSVPIYLLDKDKVIPYSDAYNVLNGKLPENLKRDEVLVGAESNEYKIIFKFQTLDNNINSVIESK